MQFFKQSTFDPIPSILNTTIISEICFGPMNSGKSEHLIGRAHLLFQEQIPFLAFKPRQDTRDGGCLKTRNPEVGDVEAILIDHSSEIPTFVREAQKGLSSLLNRICERQPLLRESPHILTLQEYLRPLEHTKIQACLTDEIFLLDSGIIEMKHQLIRSGIHVFSSGLDKDFRREPFPLMDGHKTMKEVIQDYEYQRFIMAPCAQCGSPGAYTQRLVHGVPAHYNNPTILIGDEEYEARCQEHHCVLGHPQGDFVSEVSLAAVG